MGLSLSLPPALPPPPTTRSPDCCQGWLARWRSLTAPRPADAGRHPRLGSPDVAFSQFRSNGARLPHPPAPSVDLSRTALNTSKKRTHAPGLAAYGEVNPFFTKKKKKKKKKKKFFCVDTTA